MKSYEFHQILPHCNYFQILNVISLATLSRHFLGYCFSEFNTYTLLPPRAPAVLDFLLHVITILMISLIQELSTTFTLSSLHLPALKVPILLRFQPDWKLCFFKRDPSRSGVGNPWHACQTWHADDLFLARNSTGYRNSSRKVYIYLAVQHMSFAK